MTPPSTAVTQQDIGRVESACDARKSCQGTRLNLHPIFDVCISTIEHSVLVGLTVHVQSPCELWHEFSGEGIRSWDLFLALVCTDIYAVSRLLHHTVIGRRRSCGFFDKIVNRKLSFYVSNKIHWSVIIACCDSLLLDESSTSPLINQRPIYCVSATDCKIYV